jgi:hypothetical protein
MGNPPLIVGLLINGAPGEFMGWAFPVRVEDLEADQRLQDAVLSVHHTAFHTFSGPAVKIIENHLGRGFFKLEQIKAQGFQMQLPVMAPPAEVKPLYRRCCHQRRHLRQQGRRKYFLGAGRRKDGREATNRDRRWALGGAAGQGSRAKPHRARAA